MPQSGVMHFSAHNRSSRRTRRVLVSGTACLALALSTFSTSIASAGQTLADFRAPQKVYGRTVDESSSAEWPSLPAVRKNAPNIVVIMTDDVGFAASSTFGGPIPTPTLDALAQTGARYNAFHTAAMCSPSRASLLTGRHPQAVGMGKVTNLPTGYDGYNSVIPDSAGTIADILKMNGYSTAMFGKGHITPEWELSQAGPFDRWPTGLGFEYFYGFLGAAASVFETDMIENTRHVSPHPTSPDYNVDRDIADRAISWIDEQRAIAPTKPFFIYFSTAAAHAPNQAPDEWLKRFRGQFDEGWDVLRARNVAQQKAMGIIPKDAQDAPRPATLPLWSSLSNDEQHLYARHMEAYAAQLAFADAQIGRVIEALRRDGSLANTLVVYVQGDNGAPEEGGPGGYLFDTSGFNAVSEPFDLRMKRIDDIGTAASFPLIPGGWGWAMNAPFPWAKRYASHFGGTRNGMVINWPGHIRNSEKIRSQFHHISDILPTILDVTNIEPPAEIDGVAQQPITGISMAYTFDGPDEASHRTRQVFALGEELAIYDNKWVATTKPVNTFWDKERPPRVPIDDRQWELYDLASDYSEAKDVAAKYPERVAAMKSLFWAEAARTGILPINPPFTDQSGRPGYATGRKKFVYTQPVRNIAESAAPSPLGTSFSINARVTIPETGGRGVLVAQGGRYAGYSFFIDEEGHLRFSYHVSPPHMARIVSDKPIPAGEHLLTAEFRSDAEKVKSGGRLTLKVDGKPVAEDRIEKTFFLLVSHNEGFDVGQDSVSPVDPSYAVGESSFNGAIKRIEFTLD
jgi:arylsulfatase A-like enzyme